MGQLVLENGHVFGDSSATDVQITTHTVDRTLDVNGGYILPGLVDAHLHLRGIGRAARQLDLKGTRSAEEVVARVAAEVAQRTDGEWIRGRGWDHNDWEADAFPTREQLDAIAPRHPVWLTRVDGHAVWVNSRALALAEVNAETEAPEGGEVVRDANGIPTGILIDNAIGLVSRQLPPATPDEIRRDLTHAFASCMRAGLTGVHDMGTEVEVLDVLREMDHAGEIPIEVTVYLDGSAEELPTLLATPPTPYGRLRIIGVKLFADGALGSRGARLFEPYDDLPESRGLFVTPPDELKTRAKQIHDAGYQIAIHAIGDEGNAAAIDAIAFAQGDDRSRRHRVEHAQVMREEDIARMARLGIVASMQPTHCTSDMPWAEARVGPERIRFSYAWRKMIDAGVHVAFGSDAPVEEHAPWYGIVAAVTRQDLNGDPAGGFYPEERVTLEEAIRFFSSAARWAGGQDDDARSFTVIDRDPRDTQALIGAQVTHLVVGGRIVAPAPR